MTKESLAIPSYIKDMPPRLLRLAMLLADKSIELFDAVLLPDFPEGTENEYCDMVCGICELTAQKIRNRHRANHQ